MGWLCHEPIIDIPEVCRIKLSRALLPFISLGSVISPMKMIVPCISDKSLPGPKLPMLQDIQIFLELMLNDRPPHDLIVQL